MPTIVLHEHTAAAAQIAKAAAPDEFTVRKSLKPGDTFRAGMQASQIVDVQYGDTMRQERRYDPAQEYRVVRILEQRADYNVAQVEPVL